MAVAGILFAAVLLWHPLYLRFIFPKFLDAAWFQAYFNIDSQARERFKIGLDTSGVASGFWCFYFIGFVILVILLALPLTLMLIK